MKFATLLDRAVALDAAVLATGHYARIARDETGCFHLRRGLDAAKDQSYFLFSLTQAQMARALFPIGDLDKDLVRAHARRLGLRVADKPDSQEICFVPDGDYAAFVEREAPSLTRAGAIVDPDGRVLGTHDGVHRFTIGQRKGLRLSSSEPLYVIGIDAEAAQVTVGRRQLLGRAALTAAAVNWTSGRAPASWRQVTAQIRHRHTPASARVRALADGRAELAFDAAQSAVTPGQAVVFYDGDEVLGGGWIE
jgi:tRNA-specific 2-thiouridylase